MVAMGLLDAELRPTDRFSTDKADPVRPGIEAPSLMIATRTHRDVDAHASFTDRVRLEAEAALIRAIERAAVEPTTTTYARLALAHRALDGREESLLAAKACLDLSVRQSAPTHAGVFDTTSARIAAEILLSSGEASYAYDVLASVEIPPALRLTLANLANELNGPDEALDLIADDEGPLVASFRGYLLAILGQHQRAVAELRKALREHPEDADAAMNLAVVLWTMGSRKKSLRNALRATRTAPGRKDFSLRYLEMLLESNDLETTDAEIKRVLDMGVVPDAEFLVIQARAMLGNGERTRALKLLDRALVTAQEEGNTLVEGEVAANRESLRFDMGRIDRDTARQKLGHLLEKFPNNDAVLINYCYVAQRRSEAADLRRALTTFQGALPDERRAFIRHQLAVLEGDSAEAAAAAMDWFAVDREASAAAAAILCLGIGMQRWEEAATIADFALSELPHTFAVMNNAAYVFAMSGRATEAKHLLAPLAEKNFVFMATYGLACLADGEIEEGMRAYRRASELADGTDTTSRSLMTLYQATVIHQLGLERTIDHTQLQALALPAVPLPDDWEDRPDFLRVRNICVMNGYPWPVHI